MRRINVYVLYWLLNLLQYTSRIIGLGRTLTHVKNPVQLFVGECITFQAKSTYSTEGDWTWRKDTIVMRSTSSRVSIINNDLIISDVEVEDSAYYSAEVETKGGRELFRFWLNVQDCGSNEKKKPNFQGKCNSWCQKKCDKTWKYFQGRCYKYFGNIKTWSDALDDCQSHNALLAVVDNDPTNEFVASLLESGEGAWIGLNDRPSESVYIWNNDKNSRSSYFQWDTNEPSNTNTKCNVENCVEMKHPSLRWNDMACNGYNAFVCQWDKCSIDVNSSCSCYKNICYQYFPTRLIWKDSKVKCEQHGGELVKVTGMSINNFLGNIISSNIWIDLNDIAEPGTYVWKDFAIGKLSNKASFFNWDNGEPNDKLYDKTLLTEKCSGEDCVQINNWDNRVKWRDIECSNKLPYVCEETRSSLLTLAAALGISLGCTAVFIVVTALIQSQLRNRKNNVQLQKLVFNIRFK